ncbi:MAG: Non-canonical purine NTP pyrophosphatase [Candidatus Peregrinibacteria bacterium GW2011_GWA2_33_10]|nr:MAG: Non-canonical purine NTP pyrophosphatase [Candidatus Peregrinibacteria bacterium GW2011_GWA2_33_10]KKP40097.1 MAG: Xanthosine triphosphate pyrophosphatase, dITP/XTP pyrophosphatase [Candidatus Peregrinibacteria bacterium GW2011_GWC2_33_13]
MQILIGTGNYGKFQEIKEALNELPFPFLYPKELNITENPEETGSTYEQNAILKARYFYEKSKIPVITDDSGIIVEALKNELGVNTRRWGAGEQATDQEWLNYFLNKISTFTEPSQRKALFICCACFYDGKTLKTFHGETLGQIERELKAKIIPGIPLSSCFRPDGFDKVYSSLTPQEKNQISHRGKAFHTLKTWLQQYHKKNV